MVIDILESADGTVLRKYKIANVTLFDIINLIHHYYDNSTCYQMYNEAQDNVSSNSILFS